MFERRLTDMAGGNISLAAGGGATVTTADVLTLLGPVTSTGGGIDLYAGWTLVQNANVTTSGGIINAFADAGAIVMANSAVTSSNGGAITYDAGKNFVVSSLNSGSGPMFVNVGGILSSAPGFGGTNFVGDSLTLAAFDTTGFTSQVRVLSVDIANESFTPTVTIADPVVNSVVDSLNDATGVSSDDSVLPPVIKVMGGASGDSQDMTTGGGEGTFGDEKDDGKEGGNKTSPKKEETKQSRRVSSCS